MIWFLLFVTGAGFVAGVWVGFGAGWGSAVRMYRDRDIGKAVERAEQDLRGR